MNDYDYTRRVSRRLLIQYAVSLLACLAGIILLALLCIFLAVTFPVWRESIILTYFLSFCRDYFPLLFILSVAFSWLGCSIHFIRKPLYFLDELAQAVDILASQEDEAILLSPELFSLEEHLNLAKSRSVRDAYAAREAEQRKNDLVVYLAHDLKTPLTSIIGYLTLLRDEPQLSPELRARYTGIALEKAERLEDLVNEFFDITRFSLTHLELEKQPADLTRMVEQVCSEFQPMLAERGLTCELQLPPKLPYVCDPDKLARVFDNLLRNACHYSFENTTVHISGREDEQEIVLTFTNAGRTISKEKLSRIFDQFFRLDSSRASQTGGAGLGLAIAKEIVELHSGTIQAWSEKEKIVFIVTLPKETP